MSTLDREIATYEALLPELLPRSGQYAVIKDDRLIGVFPDYEEALIAGYRKHLHEAFLVRQISPEPHVHEFSRDMILECLP